MSNKIRHYKKLSKPNPKKTMEGEFSFTQRILQLAAAEIGKTRTAPSWLRPSTGRGKNSLLTVWFSQIFQCNFLNQCNFIFFSFTGNLCD